MNSYKINDATSKYGSIIVKELKLKASQHTRNVIDIDTFFILQFSEEQIRSTSLRLLEIAKNSTVLRCGNVLGHLTNDTIAYESDGAHTNLMRALVKYAMDFIYGWGANSPNYYREEIDEAALIHDLPENTTGDIPDNRNRNEANKVKAENTFIEEFMKKAKPRKPIHAHKVRKLLQQMQDKSTTEGRILYTADKLSAIIMMLVLDHLELFPYSFPGEPAIARRSDEELNLCTKRADGSILLSDAWTVDFLHGRRINQYDDHSFFTAILIMTTLLVKGEWYDWRYKQYK